MGCVTAYGYRVGTPIEASGNALGQRVVAYGCAVIQSVVAYGYAAVQSVVASGYRYGCTVQAFGYAVCPLPSDAFLKVTPQVMWLTEDNGYSGLFEIESNTKWNVE